MHPGPKQLANLTADPNEQQNRKTIKKLLREVANGQYDNFQQWLQDAGIKKLNLRGLISKVFEVSELSQALSNLGEALENTKVKSVDLSDNELLGEEVKSFLLSLKNTRVKTIDLSSNDIENPTEINHLLEGLAESKITGLSLYFNRLKTEGIATLANGLGKTQLTFLDLGQHQMGNDAAVRIMQALPNTTINNIDLHANDIDDAGMEKIVPLLSKTKLHTLNLSLNRLNNKNLTALVQELPATKIKDLNLWGCSINAAGANNMTEIFNAFKTQLTSLSLGMNGGIKDEGVQALASALEASKVKCLDEKGAPILDKQGKFIYINKACRLEQINLDRTEITAKGIKSLAKALVGTGVTSLSLKGNDIDKEALAALNEYLPNTCIIKLELDLDDETLPEAITLLNIIEANKKRLLYKPYYITQFHYKKLNEAEKFKYGLEATEGNKSSQETIDEEMSTIINIIKKAPKNVVRNILSFLPGMDRQRVQKIIKIAEAHKQKNEPTNNKFKRG